MRGVKCQRHQDLISSREFLEKVHIDEDLPGLVFMEDLIKDRAGGKAAGVRKGTVHAAATAGAQRGFSADDVATIDCLAARACRRACC